MIRVFSCPLLRPDARQHYFWAMCCIFVCHPHLTLIPLSHSCLGTGMRFGTQNKFCHSCIIGSFGVLVCFLIPVGLLVGAVSRYCHSWYRLFGHQQLWQILVRCVCCETRYSITILPILHKILKRKIHSDKRSSSHL